MSNLFCVCVLTARLSRLWLNISMLLTNITNLADFSLRGHLLLYRKLTMFAKWFLLLHQFLFSTAHSLTHANINRWWSTVRFCQTWNTTGQRLHSTSGVTETWKSSGSTSTPLMRPTNLAKPWMTFSSVSKVIYCDDLLLCKLLVSQSRREVEIIFTSLFCCKKLSQVLS